VKKFLKKIIPIPLIHRLNRFRSNVLNGFVFASNPYIAIIHTYINLVINSRKKDRKLEIGPGLERIAGFETVNIIWGKDVDYVMDASKRMPFQENTFQIVYASHILEHIPWYQVQDVLKEWFRVLRSDGVLEIFVPDGYLIAKTFVEAELGISNNIDNDGWYKFNSLKDPCIWANGRIFSYGDGSGSKGDPNWHLSLFSKRYLEFLLKNAGFVDIVELSREDVRGYDHGWINLGLSGRKP
jgi:SAM-dependent methyltransferase